MNLKLKKQTFEQKLMLLKRLPQYPAKKLLDTHIDQLNKSLEELCVAYDKEFGDPRTFTELKAALKDRNEFAIKAEG